MPHRLRAGPDLRLDRGEMPKIRETLGDLRERRAAYDLYTGVCEKNDRRDI